MFKAIVICSLVVFASAGLLPEQHGAYDAHAYEVHAPANYDFSYSVQDGHTGDVKEQQESRRGDAVQGSYSLVEPDGHKRIVHYADDGHSGFNAVVQREGTVHHQQPAAVAVHAAPAVVSHAVAAPVYVQHQQPAAVAVHAAPAVVSHAAAPALAYSHGPVSHQTFSAPVIAQQTYTHTPVAHVAAAPAYQTIQPIQQVGYASHGYAGQGYAGQGYAGQGYAGHASGYSTVSQVTHHGGYHH